MTQVASKILGTVNAPYGADVSACELAACISNPDAMSKAIGPVFSFFTEVDPGLQSAFAEEMGLDAGAVKVVAQLIASKCGNHVALAA